MRLRRPVVEAATAPGGFSPGLAARIVCGDGRRWFVTAASGRHPALLWEDGQAGQVLGALDRLADVLTPAPITAPAIGQYLGTDFTGWRILAQTPGDERLDR